jgi:nucleoside 2-deoxyribosyltransferase
MTKRNQWMVERADLVIVNVERTEGGAAAAMRYAERLHIPVINLAEAGGDGQKM